MFRFAVDDEPCRIRSVVSDRPEESANDLSCDSFLARDANQDGVIDFVVVGDLTLAEAQHIYVRGLAEASSKDGLARRAQDDPRGYGVLDDDAYREISSFRTESGAVFNEFVWVTGAGTTHAIRIVAIDHGADGELDAILSGEASLNELQRLYARMIVDGLASGMLVRYEEAVVTPRTLTTRSRN